MIVGDGTGGGNLNGWAEPIYDQALWSLSRGLYLLRLGRTLSIFVAPNVSMVYNTLENVIEQSKSNEGADDSGQDSLL